MSLYFLKLTNASNKTVIVKYQDEFAVNYNAEIICLKSIL